MGIVAARATTSRRTHAVCTFSGRISNNILSIFRHLFPWFKVWHVIGECRAERYNSAIRDCAARVIGYPFTVPFVCLSVGYKVGVAKCVRHSYNSTTSTRSDSNCSTTSSLRSSKHPECSAFPLALRGARFALLLLERFSSELESEAKGMLTLPINVIIGENDVRSIRMHG
jgi:hypothetical protein